MHDNCRKEWSCKGELELVKRKNDLGVNTHLMRRCRLRNQGKLCLQIYA